MTIPALLKRVEEATGSDGALDAALTGYFGESAAHLMHGLRGRDEWANMYAKPFTSSLDAALALVEKEMPGWECRIQRNVDGEIWATIGMGFDSKFGCATPALALLSAFLRAKITEQAP